MERTSIRPLYMTGQFMNRHSENLLDAGIQFKQGTRRLPPTEEKLIIDNPLNLRQSPSPRRPITRNPATLQCYICKSQASNTCPSRFNRLRNSLSLPRCPPRFPA